jgi:hypothetical protein
MTLHVRSNRYYQGAIMCAHWVVTTLRRKMLPFCCAVYSVSVRVASIHCIESERLHWWWWTVFRITYTKIRHFLSKHRSGEIETNKKRDDDLLMQTSFDCASGVDRSHAGIQSQLISRKIVFDHCEEEDPERSLEVKEWNQWRWVNVDNELKDRNES